MVCAPFCYIKTLLKGIPPWGYTKLRITTKKNYNKIIMTVFVVTLILWNSNSTWGLTK